MWGGKVSLALAWGVAWIFLLAAGIAQGNSGRIIAKAQYLIDNDPLDVAAAWQDVPLPADCAYDEAQEEFFLPAVDVSTLTPGEHILYFRLQDDSGQWGVPRMTRFTVPTDPPDTAPATEPFADRCHAGWIVAAEYFIDTDPGPGNGIPLPIHPDPEDPLRGTVDATITIDDPTPLQPGRHTVFVRFQDASGRWGLARPIGPHDPAFAFASTFDSPVSNAITAAEYFIDTDPGPGNGVPLAVSPSSDGSGKATIETTITIDDPALFAAGPHEIFVRFRDRAGRWGPAERLGVEPEAGAAAPKSPGPDQATLAAAQYCITQEESPATCQWHPLPATDGAFDSAKEELSLDALSIDLAGFTNGIVSFYLRFQDSDGNWGYPRKTVFQIRRPAVITAAKYTITPYLANDALPPPGTLIELPAVTPESGDPLLPMDGAYDSTKEVGALDDLSLDVSSLSLDTAWGLYVSFQDDHNRWSVPKGMVIWGDRRCDDPDVPRADGICDEDCAGVAGGLAYLDDCGECVAGTTGKQPCPPDPCPDRDNDGYSANGGECGPVDCDDTDPSKRLKRTAYLDNDGDGYGAGEAISLCISGDALPTGYATLADDCQDDHPGIHPMAPELCDGIDNDCDGALDEGCVTVTTETGSTGPVASALNNQGEIVWLRWHDGSGAYQPFSTTRGWLLTDPTQKFQVTVNDLGWLAWTEWTGTSWRLRCRIDGKDFLILEIPAPTQEPILLDRPVLNNNGLLVFVDRRTGMGRIFKTQWTAGADGGAWGAPQPISPPDVDADQPFLNDWNEVVWRQRDPDCGCAHIWALFQNATTAVQLDIGSTNPTWPCITNFEGAVVRNGQQETVREIIWLDTDEQGRTVVLSNIRGTLQILNPGHAVASLTVNGRGDIVWVEQPSSAQKEMRLQAGNLSTYFFIDVDADPDAGKRYRITIENFNNVEARLSIVLRAADGTVQAVDHRRLAPHQALSLEPTQLAGGDAFSGSVAIWSSVPVACMGVQEDGGHSLVSATPPSRQALSHLFPSIKDTRTGTGNKESLLLFNPAETTARLTIILRDFSGGLQTAPVHRDLAPGSRFQGRLVDLFGLDTVTGWVEVKAENVPVAAVMVFAPNTASRTAYVAPAPTTHMVVPKIKATDRMMNFLALVNPNGQDTDVTVRLHTWNETGDPQETAKDLHLQPGEKRTITVLPRSNRQTDHLLTAQDLDVSTKPITGFITVEATLPVAASHTIRWDDADGAALAVSTVLPVLGEQSMSFPVVDTLHYDHTIAAVNAEAQTALVRLLVTDVSGKVLEDRTVELVPHGRTFLRLADVVGKTTPFSGSVTMFSDQPVVGHLTVYNEANAYEILPALGAAEQGNVADSDRDGIDDATEQRRACLNPYRWDTDGDGIGDGLEDANHNGILDAGETDPCTWDPPKDLSTGTLIRLLRYLAGYAIPTIAGLDLTNDAQVSIEDAVILLKLLAAP